MTDETLEEKSEALDETIGLMVPDKLARNFRILMGVVLAAITLMGVALTLQFITLRNHQEEINSGITEQIPSLRNQLRVRDAEIRDLEHMLNEDAVPGIIKMLDQIRKLGGTPPEILIQPPPRRPNDPRDIPSPADR